MDDADATIALLDRLRERGVRIAVDDFGTGYSSLTYLRRFPIDILKLDRELIASPGGADARLTRALLGLGRDLELQTVAEGIERPDQLAELVAELGRLRREEGTDAAAPFDVAVELEPGSDPGPFAAAGATWGLVAFAWDSVSVDQVRGVIREGPPPMPQRSNSRV